MRNLIIIGVIFLLSACKHLTPYEAEFSCPQTFGGKCISTTAAYEESIEGGEDISPKAPINPSDESGEGEQDVSELLDIPDEPEAPEVTYFNALVEIMTGILKEPKPPMIKPPQVIRVLILPYEGKSTTLYMPRYVYLIVDQAKWILNNQLTGQSSGSRSQEVFPGN